MTALAESNEPLGCQGKSLLPTNEDPDMDFSGRPKDANRVQILKMPFWILETLFKDVHGRKLHAEGLMVKAEGFPEDARIVEILPSLSPTGSNIHNTVVFKVWSKSFPYVMDGCTIPEFDLMFREDKLVCTNCGCDPVKGMLESNQVKSQDARIPLGTPQKWEDGADVPPGCNYLESESDSSCSRGTKGCVIHHSDTPEEPKPRNGWF